MRHSTGPNLSRKLPVKEGMDLRELSAVMLTIFECFYEWENGNRKIHTGSGGGGRCSQSRCRCRKTKVERANKKRTNCRRTPLMEDAFYNSRRQLNAG